MARVTLEDHRCRICGEPAHGNPKNGKLCRMHKSEKNKKYRDQLIARRRAGLVPMTLDLDELRCSSCKLVLPIADFVKCAATPSGYNFLCKVCQTASRYKLTKMQYLAYFEAANYTCQIPTCDKPATCLDHAHHVVPIHVRGVLCREHNIALGLCNDSPMDLRAAAMYLESTNRHQFDELLRTNT